MSLIKWELLNGIDRLLDEQTLPSLPKIGWDLAVDIFDEKGNVITKMNLPGLKEEEVEISIDGNILMISGKHEEDKETKDKKYYSKEIRSDSFSRTITLPTKVYADKAKASFEDGVLVVTVPAVEELREKPVKVQIS
jgi:HSP20 family protein